MTLMEVSATDSSLRLAGGRGGVTTVSIIEELTTSRSPALLLVVSLHTVANSTVYCVPLIMLSSIVKLVCGTVLFRSRTPVFLRRIL